MSKVTVIAEAGVNHNGSLEMAKQLVDVAAAAGADVVKFQTFRADQVVCKDAPKAAYQIRQTGASETQLEMIRTLELSQQEHRELLEHCAKVGIRFLSTPFDIDSLEFLTGALGVDLLKIASGELTNAQLLYKAALSGKPLILSTGMSTLGEIENALGGIACGYLKTGCKPGSTAFHAAYCSPEGQSVLRERVTLLHCTSEYPAPSADVNLRAMDTLAAAFSLPVGLSDHTLGNSVAIAAVARGAAVIEKHVTLNKDLPGPDHRASLEPQELKDLVDAVRQVEVALGVPMKLPSRSEQKNISIVRRSLVASAPIRRGELFTEHNLGAKRPGGGVSAANYWDFIGQTASRDYAQDEQIS